MSKKYIIEDCEASEFLSNVEGGICDEFQIGWKDLNRAHHASSSEQIEARFEGDVTNAFFYSLDEAREFCKKFAEDVQAKENIDLSFNIYEVGDVMSEQTTRRGKVISEQKYFKFLIHVEEVLIESLTEDDLSDFEKEVFENCCDSEDVAQARKIAKWISERFNVSP